MTEFILAEQPELTASEAIARSKELMTGNRWRLFCLHFSFIGWYILCMFTLGIDVYKRQPEAHIKQNPPILCLPSDNTE